MAEIEKATFDFFRSKLCKNSFKLSGKVPSLAVSNGKSVTGLAAIAKHMQRTNGDYSDLSLEKRMEVEQWIEFATTTVKCSISESEKNVLKELNSYLKDRAYFVAERMTVADVIMLHNLYPLIAELTFQEKETHINVCRWFQNVQQEQVARQSLQPLTFLRTLVYNGVRAH